MTDFKMIGIDGKVKEVVSLPDDSSYKLKENNKKYSSYQISDIDQEKISEWKKEHNPNCKFYDDGTQPGNPAGAIGGRMSYTFTPTGLGVIFKMGCACGESLDLTDYDMW